LPDALAANQKNREFEGILAKLYGMERLAAALATQRSS
jgi:hypothetical protein